MGRLIEYIVKKLQATEGGRRMAQDILNWQNTTPQQGVRKNNFLTYPTQIDQINQMYSGRSDYGSPLTRTGIDIRTAFIAGEGLSVTGGSAKSTRDWINEFLRYNRFKGSKFIEAVKLCEKEGKCLLIIKKVGNDLETLKIKIKIVRYSQVKYTVHFDEFGDYAKVTWMGDDGNEQAVQADSFVYINYDSYDDDPNDSSPPIANVIQQIINYDRALYDIRESNHLFGRVTPVITGKDERSAARILNQINTTNWRIGQALVTDGDAKYLTPGTDATESLSREMSLNIKLVSGILGIPVHWAGWTDLMSNRATAETLSELVETMTKEIRLKWIEGIEELVRKAMVKSMKFGGDSKDLDGFDVALPQITAEKIKELIDAWFVLTEAGYVAKKILINKLPGVDPEENEKYLKKEADEKESRKPPAAAAFEGAVQDMDDEDQEVFGNGE